MATLKKKRKKGPPLRGLARVKHWLWSRGRAVVALLVVALLGWGMQVVWQRAAPSIIHRDRYLLTAEGIEISTLPSWITADVRMEVVRNSGLDRRLSVLDEAFVNVVEDAFALHPWVESVDKITKSYPPAVFVDLTFRRPVAVVELASAEGVQLVPVDKLGIQLPEENVPDISKRYLPRIGGIVGRPPVGQQWADPRVLGATELAELLADHWESLHLVDILPSARPEIREEHRYFVFHLITRGGTRSYGELPRVTHRRARTISRQNSSGYANVPISLGLWIPCAGPPWSMFAANWPSLQGLSRIPRHAPSRIRRQPTSKNHS